MYMYISSQYTCTCISDVHYYALNGQLCLELLQIHMYMYLQEYCNVCFDERKRENRAYINVRRTHYNTTDNPTMNSKSV